MSRARHVPFPSEIMVGAAGQFAEMYGCRFEAPNEFFFMSYLTCLGNILASKVYIPEEKPQQPRLYTVLLGESSTVRKSTAIERTIKFFANSNPIGFSDLLSVCYGVGSAEGLEEYLNETPNLILVYDEFKSFVDKASVKGSVLLACVSTLFEKNVYENRTRDHHIQLTKANLSLLAASTEDTYDSIWEKGFVDIGLPNRLFIVPGYTDKMFSRTKPIPATEMGIAKTNYQRIINLVGSGLELDLTKSADKLYDDWYMQRERQDYTKRIETYALRLMSLFTVQEYKSVVDVDIVEKVIQLVNWQIEVRRLYDPITAETYIGKIQARIIRIMASRKHMRFWDLMRALHYKRIGSMECREAVRRTMIDGFIAVNDDQITWLGEPQ